MANTIKSKIQSSVIYHIFHKYGGNKPYMDDIFASLQILLDGTFKEYNFQVSPGSIIDKDENIQSYLSRINEKGEKRKSAGVYYTDDDVSDYIVYNSAWHFINPQLTKVSDVSSIKSDFSRLDESQISELLKLIIYDPTCGAGAFLISALSLKLELFRLYGFTVNTIYEIVGTIRGNDIDPISTDITKLRLFFFILDSSDIELDVVLLAKTISNGFSNFDAVAPQKKIYAQYDIIVGNPPYIEYGKYDGTILNDFGNVYADVMKNVVSLLSENGVIGFVVPLSYISTSRMSSIRRYVQKNTGKQILLNFADRPDCLFSGVHQKLTIVFAQRSEMDTGIYTSKYHHWYKTERNNLFSDIPVQKISEVDSKYWPKIGDDLAGSIYSKIVSYSGDDLLSLNTAKDRESIFINLRACFWMKAFSYDMKSNSYKEYKVDKAKIPFVLCLLNSSLFFVMWTIVSDGWHVTNKELSLIKVPSLIPKPRTWASLAKKLEKRLEETKVFVGTKQVDYEYKHKLCKDIIDEIDKELQSVYGLSDDELEYVKMFNEKYRLSDGA